MHELSLARSIISIAENAMPGNSRAVIKSIGLQIGELSSIEIDSLKFAFSIIKSKTLLENADLDIEVIPGEAECLRCKEKFSLHTLGTCCPQCNSYSMKVLTGREMRVMNMVVDE